MAERVELEQNTPAWHEYRAHHVNASEAGAYMGCGKFKPRNVVELLGLRRGEWSIYQNAAMSRGQELEPMVRARVCETLGQPFEPAVYRNGRFSASLDGIHGAEGLEIKCPAGSDSDLFLCSDAAALKKNAPHYYWQVVHQFYAAGLALCWFVVFHPDRPLHFAQLSRDDIAGDLDALVAAGSAFLEHLDNGTTPELERTDAEWLDAVADYRAAKAQADALDAKLADAKKRLQALGGGKGGGLSVVRVEGRTTVDYKTALAHYAPGADVAEFTKKGEASWRFTEAKK